MKKEKIRKDEQKKVSDVVKKKARKPEEEEDDNVPVWSKINDTHTFRFKEPILVLALSPPSCFSNNVALRPQGIAR